MAATTAATWCASQIDQRPGTGAWRISAAQPLPAAAAVLAAGLDGLELAMLDPGPRNARQPLQSTRLPARVRLRPALPNPEEALARLRSQTRWPCARPLANPSARPYEKA